MEQQHKREWVQLLLLVFRGIVFIRTLEAICNVLCAMMNMQIDVKFTKGHKDDCSKVMVMITFADGPQKQYI